MLFFYFNVYEAFYEVSVSAVVFTQILLMYFLCPNSKAVLTM